MASKRLPCQVCGRQLTLSRDGLVRPHKIGSTERVPCRGVGYRHARWPVGQKLQHHSGSVWVVLRDVGAPYGDYIIQCVSAPKFSGEKLGNTTNAHGEYMHRHGWTPIEDDCTCGHGFDRHDHRLIDAPCRDCEEPYECSAYEPDLATPTYQEETP